MEDAIDRLLAGEPFSIRTAHYMALAANAAYEEQPGPWCDQLGLTGRVALFTCDQFHGFVGRLEGAVVLAFRGTENVANCLTDAETALVEVHPYPGRVHQGFSEAIDTVWPEVRRLLRASGDAPLWVAGHSLGGAMATLASVRLTAEGRTVQGVYTYGSPRVGDRRFRDEYDLDNYRFVHDNDLVPHLPFRWCYKHVGDLKLLDADGNLTEEQLAWKDKKRVLRGRAKAIQIAHRRPKTAAHAHHEFDWLSDHYLEGYLAAIAKILARVPRRLRRAEDLVRQASHTPDVAKSESVLKTGPAADVPLAAVLPRVDALSPGVAPPHSSVPRPISAAALAEAFFRQPKKR